MTEERKKNRKPASVTKAELYDYLISHYVNAQESVFSDDGISAIYQLNITISLPRSDKSDIILRELRNKENNYGN